MLELTMIALGLAVVFFLFRFAVKNTEVDVMSILMSTIALAAVLQDEEIVNDQWIYFVIPLFYSIITSAISMVTNGKEGRRK